jgi:hypothetical protein
MVSGRYSICYVSTQSSDTTTLSRMLWNSFLMFQGLSGWWYQKVTSLARLSLLLSIGELAYTLTQDVVVGACFPVVWPIDG